MSFSANKDNVIKLNKAIYGEKQNPNSTKFYPYIGFLYAKRENH